MTTLLTHRATPGTTDDIGWQLVPAADGSGTLAPKDGGVSVAGNSGTRAVHPLPSRLDGPVRLQAEVLVQSGVALFAAVLGADASPSLKISAEADWQPVEVVFPNAVDQIVLYLDADGSDATVRSMSCTTLLTDTPAATALDDTAAQLPAVRPAIEAASPAAPPLAVLDTGGSATVISYQVPEPTSYQVHSVIAIADYTMDDFADVVAGSTVAPNTLAATPPQTDLVVPHAVVISDRATPGPVIALAPFDLAPRLAALTWADVANAAAGQKRVEVYLSLANLYDYRVRDVAVTPTSAPSTSVIRPATAIGSRAIRPADTKVGSGGGSSDPGGSYNPYIIATLTAPNASNPTISGPWNGVVIPVTGMCRASQTTVASISVQVSSNNAAVGSPVSATRNTIGAWQTAVTITTSGTYSLTVTAVAGDGTRANASVQITVNLDAPPASPPPTPPSIAPSVNVTTPRNNAIVVAPNGTAILTVTGAVDSMGGSAIADVGVSADGGAISQAATTPGDGTESSFTTTVELSGFGVHQVLVTAANTDGLSAPSVSLTVKVSATQPVQAIDRRLFLIETIAMSSFLGSFGASRVVKTFTLLPGEQTQLSVDSYTKSETTSKAAQSILDSTATECAADFEDTLNAENDNKASNSDATTKSIQADIGGGVPVFHADIKGGWSDQTNASHEQMAKTVKNALAKHTSKASSNRSVNVNTEFSQTVEVGGTSDTTRTLNNINVSRVLNYVFRQMTQEHIVLTHLVDVSLGFYQLDVVLDAVGQPQKGSDGGPLTQETITQYTLPEVGVFERTELTGAASTTLQSDLLAVLGDVRDIDGASQSLVELVTPQDAAGNPVPSTAYLHVKRGMTSTYTSPGGASFTVPGIVLDATSCVMRTDQLLVDAVLGEGDALDSYSHALQDVAIAERQAAVSRTTAAVAREQLAQQIVTSKDADMAAVWATIFPQSLSVPATITVPAGQIDNVGAVTR